MSETKNDPIVVSQVVPPDREGVSARAVAGEPYPFAAGYNQPAIAYLGRQVSPSTSGVKMAEEIEAILGKLPKPPRNEEELKAYEPPPAAILLGALRDLAILVFGPIYAENTIEEGILPRLGPNEIYRLGAFANRNIHIQVAVEPGDDDPNAKSPAATVGPTSSTSSN